MIHHIQDKLVAAYRVVIAKLIIVALFIQRYILFMDVKQNDLESITAFTNELILYENSITLGSTHFCDYHRSVILIKNPLFRLIGASDVDTFSMMRRLMERVSSQQDGAYSDYTIAMLGSSAIDQRARQLITAILYNVREMLDGQSVYMDDEWLQIVGGNEAIRTFIQNYAKSNEPAGETYSGNAIGSVKVTRYQSTREESCVVDIQRTPVSHRVILERETPQVISFQLDPIEFRTAEFKTVVTDVTIKANIGHFIIDKSVKFLDDALAQIKALGCARSGVVAGQDTEISLPGLFHRMVLYVVTSDNGATWKVNEVNILPPELDSWSN